MKNYRERWINYCPLGSLGIALNKNLFFFTEYAGQYAGVGVSVRPLKMPLTVTFMLRDF